MGIFCMFCFWYLKLASQQNDVQLMDFIESEFLNEQVKQLFCCWF